MLVVFQMLLLGDNLFPRKYIRIQHLTFYIIKDYSILFKKTNWKLQGEPIYWHSFETYI